MAEVGPLLQVDLQVARSLEAVRLNAASDPGAIFRQWNPGYHGLRLTVNQPGAKQARKAWMWPATALASNIQPRSQMVQMLASVGCRVDDLPLVGRSEVFHLDRFAIVHVVRPSLGKPVEVLDRGHRAGPGGSLSSAALRDLGDRLAGFLRKRSLSDGRMAGTFCPSSDTYETEIAPRQDAALAAYALVKHVAVMGGSGSDPAVSVELNAVVRRTGECLSRELLALPPEEYEESDWASVAIGLMAIQDSPALVGDKSVRDALVARLLDQPHEEGWSCLAGGASQAKPRRVTSATQALIVSALSKVYRQTRDDRIASRLVLGDQALWRKQQPEKLIGALPWLKLDDPRVDPADAMTSGADAPGAGERVEKLKVLVEFLLSKQFVGVGQPGSVDELGGFPLTKVVAGVEPYCDWQSTRVLAFLAEALRSPVLSVAHDRVGWLLDCGLAARFVDQLTFNEASGFYVRSPAEVLGGVRTSLWDNRVSVGPAAMALIAVTELQETLRSMESQTHSD
jgi:hypothetical protein